MSQIMTEIVSDIIRVHFWLLQTGVNMLGVYLIGQYLAAPFLSASTYVSNIALRVSMLRSRVIEFETWVRDNISGTPILQELAAWGAELLRFIRNPYPYIYNLIRGNLPRLFQMLDATFDFIRPHVERFLDTFFLGWRDVKTLVIRFLTELVQDFSTLRSNPVRWVYDRLRLFSATLGAFLADPDGWVKDKVRIFFPELYKMVLDPADYVLDKMVSGLEKYINRYLTRILKAVEHVLNIIF